MRSLVPQVRVFDCYLSLAVYTELYVVCALSVAQVAREDISELHVADFVLGMLFVQPYVTFEDVYRGYGSEVP